MHPCRAAARNEDWSCIRHARGCRPLAPPCVPPRHLPEAGVLQRSEDALTIVTHTAPKRVGVFPRSVKKFPLPAVRRRTIALHTALTTITLCLTEIESAGMSTQRLVWASSYLRRRKYTIKSCRSQPRLGTSVAPCRKSARSRVVDCSHHDVLQLCHAFPFRG